MAQRAPHRPTARIEEAIGFVGFTGVMFLGVTLYCEFTGRPALTWALVLLGCVLAVVALDRWRVRVLRRTADASTGGAGVGRRDEHPVGVHVPGGRMPTETVFRDHVHVGWDDPAPRPRTRTRVATAAAGAAPPTGAADDVTRGRDG